MKNLSFTCFSGHFIIPPVIRYQIENQLKLLNFFVLISVAVTVSLIISTVRSSRKTGHFDSTLIYGIQITIFFHFVPVNEAHNFTQGEARVSRFLAKFLNCITCGIWTIKIPPGTEIICDMQRNAFRSKTP